MEHWGVKKKECWEKQRGQNESNIDKDEEEEAQRKEVTRAMKSGGLDQTGPGHT